MKYKPLLLLTLLIGTGVGVYLWVARPYRVAGDCMEPALKDGQRCFVNAVYYKLFPFKAGDVVAFRYEGKAWLARIIALEGQTFEMKDQTILVNQGVYAEAIERNWQSWRYGQYGIEKPVKIPPGHVWVLSDDLSAHHDDSRIFGPIPCAHILGKVW